jgi:uncharacterized membrane protein YdfJ with MMPL/SSD domain
MGVIMAVPVVMSVVVSMIISMVVIVRVLMGIGMTVVAVAMIIVVMVAVGVRMRMSVMLRFSRFMLELRLEVHLGGSLAGLSWCVSVYAVRELRVSRTHAKQKVERPTP